MVLWGSVLRPLCFARGEGEGGEERVEEKVVHFPYTNHAVVQGLKHVHVGKQIAMCTCPVYSATTCR